MWIEIKWLGYIEMTTKSYRASGMWIEILVGAIGPLIYSGHTARAVCGLKSPVLRDNNSVYRHTARAVCGLKSQEIYAAQTSTNCHTARAVCGLKYTKYHNADTGKPSYRASGMWIEIRHSSKLSNLVKSYRASGMWIEIILC